MVLKHQSFFSVCELIFFYCRYLRQWSAPISCRLAHEVSVRHLRP